MKRLILIQSVIIAALAAALLWSGSRGGAFQLGVAQASGGDDDSPPMIQAATTPIAPTAPSATPTTTVYFDQQDNVNNGTVIVLYNTTAVTQTVAVKSYWPLGLLYGPWTVTIGPHGVAHVITDQLAANPPGSWANTVYANFTDATTYGSLDVPSGVHVDGYIVFNSSTGMIDPNVYQDATPLRFSIDPYTVMLPTVMQ